LAAVDRLRGVRTCPRLSRPSARSAPDRVPTCRSLRPVGPSAASGAWDWAGAPPYPSGSTLSVGRRAICQAGVAWSRLPQDWRGASAQAQAGRREERAPGSVTADGPSRAGRSKGPFTLLLVIKARG